MKEPTNRYYVSRKLVRGEPLDSERGWRISAPEIERTVSAAAQAILSDRAAITLSFEQNGRNQDELPAVMKSAQVWIERLESSGDMASALYEITERVEVSSESLKLSLKLPFLPVDAGDGAIPEPLSLVRLVPMK